jgi:hypothetical protein
MRTDSNSSFRRFRKSIDKKEIKETRQSFARYRNQGDKEPETLNLSPAKIPSTKKTIKE